MALTDAERDQYWRDGHLLVRGLIDSGTLERIDSRFVDLASGVVAPPSDMVIMQDIAYVKGAAVKGAAKGGATPKTPLHAVNKILSFENDPVLWPFATDDRLVSRARSLVGRELKTLSTNVFNKPPGVDGRHPLHQDLRYFALRPADKIVATWTAIGPCTRENGCLAVVPGSHRGELAEHAEPDWDEVNFGFFAAQGVDRDARVHVPMEPGDTLFFHPLLVHGSGHNQSDGFRRAVSVHYAARECARPEEFGGQRPKRRAIAAAIKDV